MPITINGTGSITGLTAGGLPDGSITSADLASGAITAGALPNGSILQVVQGTTSTEVAVSTTTYTDTGLSASITPTSSTSKILVLVNQQIALSRSTSYQYAGLRLYRNSDLIYDPLADSNGPFEYAISANAVSSVSFNTRATISLLDEPGSTDPLTYKTQGRPYSSNNSGSIVFNKNGTDGNATSYIILLEVAA